MATRTLNPQRPRGWARIVSPRYVAHELAGEPGVYVCAARGAGTWSEHQLAEWAKAIGAEVVLVEREAGRPNWRTE